MSNHSRNYLVSQFFCAACGHQLTLSYIEPPKRVSEGGESGGLSGAEKVVTNTFVEPCQACLRPVRKVKEALAVLASLGE